MNTNYSNRNVGGIILIGLGVFFLAGRMFDLGDLWPLFILVPGFAFLVPALTGGKNSAGLIFPGLIVTGTGAILLYQNMTGHWESWAYAWTLYPLLVGMGLIFVGQRTNNDQNRTVGRGMVTWSLVGLVVMGALFEGLIFRGAGNGITDWILPIALIGLGAFMLFRNHSENGVLSEKPKNMPSADINPNLRRKIDEAISEDQTI
jgi:hypothetical protein